MKIYLARNNVQAGPYTLDELNTMLSSGEVTLEDLAWHAGMTNWQRLGELTGGQYRYTPNLTSSEPIKEPRAFGDNVDFAQNHQSTTDKRVSVAELYGRSVPQTEQSSIQPVASQQVNPSELVYASIGSRFLALAINLTLFIIAFMPFVSALIKLNPDQQKMTSGSFEARMAYAQTLAEQIPSQVVWMTMMMIGGFLLIQFVLILMRGQSFGKLVTGIRAVSEQTGKLPSLGSLLGVRTILLLVIYWLASTLPFNIAFVLVGVNYFMATTNPKKQGWHDKLAKTVVVKAHPSQLDKAKK